MEASEVIHELEAAGVRLEAVNGKVRMTPGSKVLDEMLASVRANKPKILRYLAERDERHALETERLLSTQGWCCVRCRELGGARVLWVLDGNVKVPVDAENLPRFTWSEVQRIVREPGLLRPLHAVKMFFPDSEVVE